MAGDKYYHSIKAHRYLRGPESIEIHTFRPQFIKSSKTVSYEVNLPLQCLHLEVLLLSKFWSDADSGPFSLFSFKLMLR